ncbi:MAG: TMEM165/GDT1 family protein [Lutispora sp.]|jgi:putative Ca2+/H+ antiporter (TMEM165/GDT1 family)|uniref:TMEM165/GDT1 family protein n=1 Tax=Lutispora sp. TaxID=2828727 RepID=UPI00356AE169
MLKVIISTFLCVFIAELGDKTQLQTMLLTAKNNSPILVFIGASLALICSSVLGVFAGTYITKYVPPNYIQNAAGILFIIMGILTLLNKI